MDIENLLENINKDTYDHYLTILESFSKKFSTKHLQTSHYTLSEDKCFTLFKEVYHTLIACKSPKYDLNLDYYIEFLYLLYNSEHPEVITTYWEFLFSFSDLVLNWNNLIKTRQITCVNNRINIFSDYTYIHQGEIYNSSNILKILRCYGLLKKVTNEVYLDLKEFLLLHLDTYIDVSWKAGKELTEFLTESANLLFAKNHSYSFQLIHADYSDTYILHVNSIAENKSIKYYFTKTLEQKEISEELLSFYPKAFVFLVNNKKQAETILSISSYSTILRELYERYCKLSVTSDFTALYSKLSYKEDYYNKIFKNITKPDIEKLSKVEELLKEHKEYVYYVKLLSLHDLVQLTVSVTRIVDSLYKDVSITTKANKTSFLYGFVLNETLSLLENRTNWYAELPKRKDLTSYLYNKLKDRLEEYQKKQNTVLKTPFDIKSIPFKGGWEVVELITVSLLVEEGEYQQHCVGGYGSNIKNSSRIFSFRRNGIRHTCLFHFLEKPNKYVLGMNEGYYRKSLSSYSIEEGSYLEYNIRLLREKLTESVFYKQLDET